MKIAWLALGVGIAIGGIGWGVLRWREASDRKARAEALVREAEEAIEGWDPARDPSGGQTLSSARSAIERALELVSDDPRAERAMGRLLYKRGKYTDAIVHYERALRARGAPAAWFREAGHVQFQIYVLRGGPGKAESREAFLAALDRYEEALERDPSDREALKYAGSLLDGEGNRERRDELWNRLLEVAPEWEGAEEVRRRMESDRGGPR